MSYPNDINSGLTAEELRSVLDYNPETGEFFWKVRPAGAKVMGRTLTRACRARTRAGYYRPRYTSITLGGRFFKAHRLAWLHYYGEWPKQFIDHINNNGHDNRIANLEDNVTIRENCQRAADQRREITRRELREAGLAA